MSYTVFLFNFPFLGTSCLKATKLDFPVSTDAIKNLKLQQKEQKPAFCDLYSASNKPNANSSIKFFMKYEHYVCVCMSRAGKWDLRT